MADINDKFHVSEVFWEDHGQFFSMIFVSWSKTAIL